MRAVDTDGYGSQRRQSDEDVMINISAEVDKKMKVLEKSLAETVTRAVVTSQTSAIPPLIPPKENIQRRPVSRPPDKANSEEFSARCYRCGQPGHYANTCTAPVRCFECNNVGHISRDCDRRQNQRDSSAGRQGHCGVASRYQGNGKARDGSRDAAGRRQ